MRRKFLKNACKLDPQNTEADLKLAELYLYLKAYPKVFEYADAALKINKHTAKAYFIKGFAFAEKGGIRQQPLCPACKL